jgi:hypothetical protein
MMPRLIAMFHDTSRSASSGDHQEFHARLGMIEAKIPTMPRRKDPRISDAVLDQLLAGAGARTALGPNGLIDDLKKALAERVLDAEMEHRLASAEPGNRCNGSGTKTVITDLGRVERAVPRDRRASFDWPMACPGEKVGGGSLRQSPIFSCLNPLHTPLKSRSFWAFCVSHCLPLCATIFAEVGE